MLTLSTCDNRVNIIWILTADNICNIYPIPLEMQVSSQELDESADSNHGGGGHRVQNVEVGDEGDVDLNKVFRDKLKKILSFLFF